MDKLVTRQQALEVEHRAAIVVEPDGTVTTHEMDNQERERRALVDESNMDRIFDAILDHRSVDGRERELQAGVWTGRKSGTACRTGNQGRHPGAVERRSEPERDQYLPCSRRARRRSWEWTCRPLR